MMLAPTGQASLVIGGFATDLPQNHDAVEIRNTGPQFALGETELRDRQGALGFPPGAKIGADASVFIATNATAFFEAFGRSPDFARDHEGAAGRMQPRHGTFALSKTGDHLLLARGSDIADAVRYGDAPLPEAGWEGPPVEVGPQFLRWFARTDRDTDSAQDWIQYRRSYAGEHLLGPTSWVRVSEGLAYTAPEFSRSVVVATFLSAQRSLQLNVYQFRDVALAQILADHMRSTPGLRVDVLLDDRPVGESREERSERGHVVEILANAGADVRFLSHGRYAYNHAKYAIIDDEVLLVQTENLVPSGIPADAREGNRGWGIVLVSPGLAAAAADVFEADFALRPFGARSWNDGDRPAYPLPVVTTQYRQQLPRVVDEDFNAKVVATPFSRPGVQDPILEAIGAANHSIEVAQLDFAPSWRNPNGTLRQHPYFDALLEAASRGVRVRILLDGTFLDDAPAGDNADLVALVSTYPHLPIEARLHDGTRGVLHAKGMIVDGSLILIGSMNWNANSMGQNRELGVVVRSPEIAATLQDVFESDWRAAGPTTIPSPSVATVLTLVGLAFGVTGRFRR
jgi:cardiolipin synthase A/B